ncbi:MAG: accessory factor UbiK family protein [Gammaproteobacteria bacterium]
MVNSQTLNELMRGILDALPAGVGTLRNDNEKNLRASLNTTFARFNLVTREEFDVQTEVLGRTRAKLQKLEEHVAHLEAELLKARK